jgi:hypothetical protein
MAQVQQILARLQIHEKIKIAVRAIFASGHRAENPDVPGPVSLGNAQDLASPLAQSFKAEPGTILCHDQIIVHRWITIFPSSKLSGRF